MLDSSGFWEAYFIPPKSIPLLKCCLKDEPEVTSPVYSWEVRKTKLGPWIILKLHRGLCKRSHHWLRAEPIWTLNSRTLPATGRESSSPSFLVCAGLLINSSIPLNQERDDSRQDPPPSLSFSPSLLPFLSVCTCVCLHAYVCMHFLSLICYN